MVAPIDDEDQASRMTAFAHGLNEIRPEYTYFAAALLSSDTGWNLAFGIGVADFPKRGRPWRRTARADTSLARPHNATVGGSRSTLGRRERARATHLDLPTATPAGRSNDTQPMRTATESRRTAGALPAYSKRSPTRRARHAWRLAALAPRAGHPTPDQHTKQTSGHE